MSKPVHGGRLTHFRHAPNVHAMLFKEIHLQGIRTGQITLAFRYWKKPQVKPGSLIKTSIGQVEIGTVKTVLSSEITLHEAQQAGYPDQEALLAAVVPFTSDSSLLFKIGVSYHGEDPRIALREITDLSEVEWAALRKKLARMDQSAVVGAWTQTVLLLIRDHPGERAQLLADMGGYEKEWLKLNIRKLKNLGLTISLETGYELSPLGQRLVRDWD